MYTVAIQPDKVVQPNGVRRSYSARWLELAQQEGIRTRIVDVHKADFFEQLAGCDGFMWRFGYRAPERFFASRLRFKSVDFPTKRGTSAASRCMNWVHFPASRSVDRAESYGLQGVGDRRSLPISE